MRLIASAFDGCHQFQFTRSIADKWCAVDLQNVLDQKIRNLPEGPHSVGLQWVNSHIQAALRHLSRGQTDGDTTLFSDTISVVIRPSKVA